jgi:hypothetical protein
VTRSLFRNVQHQVFAMNPRLVLLAIGSAAVPASAQTPRVEDRSPACLAATSATRTRLTPGFARRGVFARQRTGRKLRALDPRFNRRGTRRGLGFAGVRYARSGTNSCLP